MFICYLSAAICFLLLLVCCLFAARAPAGEWSRIAPLRILSIDIECAGRKGHFPEAQLDPVIQIASMVTVLGENKPRVKNIMTLGSCAAIVGAEVGVGCGEGFKILAGLDATCGFVV
jgi:DNA polymerase elongation subunit (family B)